MNAGYPTPVCALLVGLVLAIAIGILNGFLISVVEMPPLLTTLASSLAVLGITRSTAVQHYVVYLAKGHDDFLKLGGNIWGGVPVPILIFGAAAVLAAPVPFAHRARALDLRPWRQSRRRAIDGPADPSADDARIRAVGRRSAMSAAS